MKRWAIALGCVLSLLGCSADDDGGGGASGNAGSGAGAGVTAGNAGAGAGGTSGTSGTSGTGGNAGTSSTAGSSGSAGTAGSSGSGGAGAGGSGGTSGSGGASGSSGTSGGGGMDGASCGSRGQMECPAGSYCDFPEEADCGRADAPGVCTTHGDIACGEIYNPVCGCDGETYGNPCEAAQAGMSVDHEGECEAAEGSYDCALEGVACLIAIPECDEGKVPSADGACFGPCVPIEECECGGPDDCPSPDKYTCWMSAGHCGPYTQ